MAQKLTVAGESIELGPVTLATADVVALVAQDVNGRGIVLANDRIKTIVPVEVDGKTVHVTYTASIYIQREPLNDDESAKVAQMAKDRETAKRLKADEEQQKRERETRRAFELGQESTVSALRNINTLAEGAKVLANLNK